MIMSVLRRVILYSSSNVLFCPLFEPFPPYQITCVGLFFNNASGTLLFRTFVLISSASSLAISTIHSYSFALPSRSTVLSASDSSFQCFFSTSRNIIFSSPESPFTAKIHLSHLISFPAIYWHEKFRHLV